MADSRKKSKAPAKARPSTAAAPPPPPPAPAASAVEKNPSPVGDWIVSCGPSTDGGLHIQARTKDQLSSFAVVVPLEGRQCVKRMKAADGVHDVFTVVGPGMKSTMNVYGHIQYHGDWSQIPG